MGAKNLAIEVVAEPRVKCKTIAVDTENIQQLTKSSLNVGSTAEQMNGSTKRFMRNLRTTVARRNAEAEHKFPGDLLFKVMLEVFVLWHNHDESRVLGKLLCLVERPRKQVTVLDVPRNRDERPGSFGDFKVPSKAVATPVNV